MAYSEAEKQHCLWVLDCAMLMEGLSFCFVDLDGEVDV